MLSIMLPFMIKADVSYYTSKGSMIANISLDPEGKYDS
jgi:hypothetical protein